MLMNEMSRLIINLNLTIINDLVSILLRRKHVRSLILKFRIHNQTFGINLNIQKASRDYLFKIIAADSCIQSAEMIIFCSLDIFPLVEFPVLLFLKQNGQFI